MFIRAPRFAPRCLAGGFRALAVAALLALGLIACSSGSSGGSSFEVRTTSYAVDAQSPLAVVGNWMVFLANETFSGALGSDLNGDTDMDDDVAVAVRLNGLTEFVLGAAAQDANILNGNVYLVVDEQDDNVDWNGQNAMDDMVLLHWDQDSAMVTFVDTLASEGTDVYTVVVSDRLYYSSDDSPAGDETSLRYVTQADPTTPVTVNNEAGGGPLEPRLLGEDDGLVFLVLDEVDEVADLNGDMDELDEYVLALLDGTDAGSRVKNVGMALDDNDAPFAALQTTANDWLVAFLVNEEDQGMTNLNPPVLNNQPNVPQDCVDNTPDVDTDDDVLAYLNYADFLADPSALVNTGLAGDDRVIVVPDFVATLSDEFEATCDLNGDLDFNDCVVRWVEAVSAPAVPQPPRDTSQLHAVQTSVGGDSEGFASLSGFLVCVVDEDGDGRELDGKPADNDLVAWLDPDDGPTAVWNFEHFLSQNIGTGLTGEPYAGATWLACEEEGGRLGIGFQESVPGLNLNNNLDCDLVTKDSDMTDSLPVWADFETGPTLDFDGLGYSVVPDNAGIVVARSTVFFRVSEMEDGVDHNGDNDMTDVVLFRNPVASCFPRFMGTASSDQGPVIVTDLDLGAAFLTSEFQAGEDLNEDGDVNDTVVQYFRF